MLGRFPDPGRGAGDFTLLFGFTDLSRPIRTNFSVSGRVSSHFVVSFGGGGFDPNHSHNRPIRRAQGVSRVVCVACSDTMTICHCSADPNAGCSGLSSRTAGLVRATSCPPHVKSCCLSGGVLSKVQLKCQIRRWPKCLLQVETWPLEDMMVVHTTILGWSRAVVHSFKC